MNEFRFTEKEKQLMLRISRNSLYNSFSRPLPFIINGNEIEIPLKQECGLFVSIYNQEKLRGCLGRLHSNNPLYKLIETMTLSAAQNDYRFSPIALTELDDLKIELSVLSPLKQIYSPDEIILGIHGIYISTEKSSGTFLPQVANKTNWTVHDFLGHCSRDKAGLGWDGWKNARIYTYEAVVIKE
jgi:AmmeMemoRadiSam system protein A